MRSGIRVWAMERRWGCCGGAISRWCCAFLRGRGVGEPEDIASQGWIDVARNLHRFDGDAGDFHRWLFRSPGVEWPMTGGPWRADPPRPVATAEMQRLDGDHIDIVAPIIAARRRLESGR